jgi:uncharacterized membrane protein
MFGGIPVALIGLIGFALILLIAVARLRSDRPALDLTLFVLSFGATLYVSYLSYLEVFVLGAICPWCVSVAICAAAIFVVTAREVLRSEPS